jgi:hypothetical protein
LSEQLGGKSEGKSVSETHQENAATTGTQKKTKPELPILLQSGIAKLSHLKLLTDVGVNMDKPKFEPDPLHSFPSTADLMRVVLLIQPLPACNSVVQMKVICEAQTGIYY